MYKRIVIKVGSSSLTHAETGKISLMKIERLVRSVVELKNSGKEVIVVSSGAIATGKGVLGIEHKVNNMVEKQALSAIGQCALIMHYSELFGKYGTKIGQVLITKEEEQNEAVNKVISGTLEQLLEYDVVPIINENDSISDSEIKFGDNDVLSAITAVLVKADLLVLLSDIDGLYDADGNVIETVGKDRDFLKNIAKPTSDTEVGTGGMFTKVIAANMVNERGIDMYIANSNEANIVNKILEGKKYGTLFKSFKD